MDVTHEERKISFTHLKKRNIKHVYLSVDKQNGVILKSGMRLSADDAKKIVLEKADWIQERLRSVQEIISTQRQSPCSLDFVFYGGKKLPLRLIEEHGAKGIDILCGETGMVITHPPEKAHRIDHALDGFYKEKTREKVSRHLTRLSEIMELFPQAVAYKKYKRRWGCCDARDKITFNTLLSQFDDEVIEYIVIHELAHIREKNHSRRFWELVGRFCPRYPAIHKKIKGPVDSHQ